MKSTFCCTRRLVSSPNSRFYLRGHCSSSSPSSHLLSQIAPAQLEEADSKNEPVRTNDPGGSQLAAGKRKAVLDWQRPSLHPSPASPPNLLWDCETVAKRLQCRGVGDGACPPSSLLVCSLCMTSNISLPQHTPRPRPFFISQGKKERLTHLCIASSVTTIGIYELASCKRADEKKKVSL